MDALSAFLDSARGQHFVDAAILLMVALAGYLSYLAKRSANLTSDDLDKHLEQHVTADLSERSTPSAIEDNPKGESTRPVV